MPHVDYSNDFARVYPTDAELTAQGLKYEIRLNRGCNGFETIGYFFDRKVAREISNTINLNRLLKKLAA